MISLLTRPSPAACLWRQPNGTTGEALRVNEGRGGSLPHDVQQATSMSGCSSGAAACAPCAHCTAGLVTGMPTPWLVSDSVSHPSRSPRGLSPAHPADAQADASSLLQQRCHQWPLCRDLHLITQQQWPIHLHYVCASWRPQVQAASLSARMLGACSAGLAPRPPPPAKAPAPTTW